MKEKRYDLILTSLKTYFNQLQYEFNKDLTLETGTTPKTSYFVRQLRKISVLLNISLG